MKDNRHTDEGRSQIITLKLLHDLIYATKEI